MSRRWSRGCGALAVLAASFLFAAGGCSSEENPACVGVSCAPLICGTSCTASCGCCDCADGEKYQDNAASYVCHGGCYQLVASDAGTDAGDEAETDASADAPSDAATD